MLFTPYTLGPLQLSNRIVLPPMTRARAGKGETATALMAEYYRQRASAGLLIGESTQISPQGQGYAWTPGIHTPAQVAGWRRVTDAVRAEGGCIFAQLWHAGRVSHTSLQPGGEAPVSCSSLLAPEMKVFVDPEGRGAESGVGQLVPHSMPRALTVAEIGQVVEDFAKAARNALQAGFDGVELHGANGYLIQQFLDAGTNERRDAYGGCLSGRLRFLREVVHAVIEEVGRERVGVRLAPAKVLQNATEAGCEASYLAAAKVMDDLGVAYLHICEADGDGGAQVSQVFREGLRIVYRGALIYSGRYTAQRGQDALRAGWADLIGFGRPFIANPDLPYRLRHGLPLNTAERSTYFGGSAQGYTNYPCANEHAWGGEAVSPTAHAAPVSVKLGFVEGRSRACPTTEEGLA